MYRGKGKQNFNNKFSNRDGPSLVIRLTFVFRLALSAYLLIEKFEHCTSFVLFSQQYRGAVSAVFGGNAAKNMDAVLYGTLVQILMERRRQFHPPDSIYLGLLFF